MPGTHNAKNASTKINLLAMMRKSCHLVLLAMALQAAAISSRGRPATAPNFYPAKISRSELYHTNSNRAVVRDVVQALKADGIIAVEVPGFAESTAVLRAGARVHRFHQDAASHARRRHRAPVAGREPPDNEAASLDVPETWRRSRRPRSSSARPSGPWQRLLQRGSARDAVEAAAPFDARRRALRDVSDKFARAPPRALPPTQCATKSTPSARRLPHRYRKERGPGSHDRPPHGPGPSSFTPALTVGAEYVSAATFTLRAATGAARRLRTRPAARRASSSC